jgi:hypothetical protein
MVDWLSTLCYTPLAKRQVMQTNEHLPVFVLVKNQRHAAK